MSQFNSIQTLINAICITINNSVYKSNLYSITPLKSYRLAKQHLAVDTLATTNTELGRCLILSTIVMKIREFSL